MENKPQSSFLMIFANKYYDKIKLFEKISILVFVIGLILLLFQVQRTDFIFIIGSISLAICYFLFAFKLLDINESNAQGIFDSNGWANFIIKLTYFALSITSIEMIELLFRFKKGTFIVIAGVTLLIALISVLLTKREDKFKVYPIDFIVRIIIAIALLIYVIAVRGTIL